MTSAPAGTRASSMPHRCNWRQSTWTAFRLMADVANAVRAFAVKDAKREPAHALDRRFLDVEIAAKDPVIHTESTQL